MLNNATTVPDYTGIPTVVFTIPELARVGLLEQEARDDGLDIDVRYRDTSGWYSSYRVAETTAASKILVDRSTDRIVGAHMLGPDYGELISTLGLAMKLGPTTRELRSAAAYSRTTRAPGSQRPAVRTCRHLPRVRPSDIFGHIRTL
jgi:glutathione reductase (NADPH)